MPIAGIVAMWADPSGCANQWWMDLNFWVTLVVIVAAYFSLKKFVRRAKREILDKLEGKK